MKIELFCQRFNERIYSIIEMYEHILSHNVTEQDKTTFLQKEVNNLLKWISKYGPRFSHLEEYQEATSGVLRIKREIDQYVFTQQNIKFLRQTH